MAEKFDLIVIGGGPAGYEAALFAAKNGMKTALVESRELGGTCLNRGCIPTKTILHSAELYDEMKSCDMFGVHAEGVACDMAAVQTRKNEVIDRLRGGIEMLMKKNKVTVYQGRAVISGVHQVNVQEAKQGTETGEAVSRPDISCPVILTAENILIATGSLPSIPPIPGTDLHDVMSSDELLLADKLYPRLTIVGGGVIGMEFASVYSALGCQVTVIEFLDRILANMDKEISQNLKMILKKRGVEIHTGAKVESITEKEDGSLVCHYIEKDTKKEAVSDGILIAAGRKSNTAGLFEEKASEPGSSSDGASIHEGVVIGEDHALLYMDRGRIIVDDYGQTSVPGIYAAGDVTPGIQLAHAATAQGINAVSHMLYRKEEKAQSVFIPPVRTDLIPGCVYTSPEIGCVGMTQEEAKAKGLDVITKKYPMSANGKSLLSNQERGFIKVVADAGTHRILGAQMMCARATDMISEFGTAIVNELTLEQMASVVRPHPTFCEGISEAVRE